MWLLCPCRGAVRELLSHTHTHMKDWDKEVQEVPARHSFRTDTWTVVVAAEHASRPLVQQCWRWHSHIQKGLHLVTVARGAFGGPEIGVGLLWRLR